MLQFEDGASGETADGRMVGEGKSLVVQFKTNKQVEGEREGNRGSMMSLLHEWGERQREEDDSQGESYVLHFHAEEPDSGPAENNFSEGQETSLQLSCTHTSGLSLPLSGQEVVFELGGDTKIQQEPEGMQMIALIGDEGGMTGEVAGCNAATGAVTEGGGSMDGIFQLESGEEIVIIEVSTSSLREGRMDRGRGGEVSQTSESGTVEAKKKEHFSIDGTEAQMSTEDRIRNGPKHNQEMQSSQ